MNQKDQYIENILSIYKTLKNNKDIQDIVNDINIIDNLIMHILNGHIIDKRIIYDIYYKYKSEIEYLSKIEEKYTIPNSVTRGYNQIDLLYYLKNSLIKIGCLRLLKDKTNDEIEKQLAGSAKDIFDLVTTLID